MATITTEAESAAKSASTTPRRRTRRPRTPDASANAGARRGRRPRLSGDALLASLGQLVDQLIKENRQLKRSLAQAGKVQGGAGVGQAAKTLSGIQRRLTRALDSTPPARRRRSTVTTAPSTRARRKVTDPQVIEQRRQSLAKARAARQAKRQAAAAQ